MDCVAQQHLIARSPPFEHREYTPLYPYLTTLESTERQQYLGSGCSVQQLERSCIGYRMSSPTPGPGPVSERVCEDRPAEACLDYKRRYETSRAVRITNMRPRLRPRPLMKII